MKAEFDPKRLIIRIRPDEKTSFDFDLKNCKSLRDFLKQWCDIFARPWYSPEIHFKFTDEVCQAFFAVFQVDDAGGDVAGILKTWKDIAGSTGITWGSGGGLVLHPSELRRPMGDDPNELLKHRFFCLQHGCLLVGQTGVGKSSFAMQCAVSWALGRECFGLVPTRPLRSLFVQAENDEEDLAEMFDGVILGMGLSESEKRQANEAIGIVNEDSKKGIGLFTDVVSPTLAEHKPEILFIDTALAYLAGDQNSQQDVGTFLRSELRSVIREHNCGVILLHHTPKPSTGKDKAPVRNADLSYMGSGSAEWINWCRSMLLIHSHGSSSKFELVAAKRGARLRWTMGDGKTATRSKIIGHSTSPGVIHWREIGEDELPAKKQKQSPTVEQLLAHVPTDKQIGKQTLVATATRAGMTHRDATALINEALETGKLFQWLTKRPNARPLISLGRNPQPPEPNPK